MKHASWKDWILPALVICFLIPLYSYSKLSTVTMEDSGIFLTSSYFFGIPQPTGYPFYTLLAWGFSHLPVGSIASRIVLLNSLLGAFSCLLVYFIVFRLTAARQAAFLSSLILGVSISFWHQSVVAEVYMLNTILFLLVFHLCLALRAQYGRKTLAFLSLAYGLGLSNHFPLLILASGAFPVLLWKRWKEILKDIWIAGIFLLIGLLPYIHLLTAHYHSQFLFLSPIENLSDLWAYLSRKNYGGIDVFKTASLFESLKFVFFFIENLIHEFSPAAFPLIIAGFVYSWFLKDKSIPIALVLALLSSSVFLLIPWRTEFTELTQDFYQYCQLIPLSICAIYVGFALVLIKSFLYEKKTASWLLVSGISVLCLVWAFSGSFKVNDLRNDTFAQDYPELLLNHLPQNAVLLLSDDADHGPVSYMHFVEGIRPDLLISSQVGVLVPVKPFDSKQHPQFEDRRVPLLNFISANLDKNRRVFTTEMLRYFDSETARFPFFYRSHGLYYEILEKPAEPFSHPGLIQDAMAMLDKYEQGKYQKQWSFHRNGIVGKISKLLIESGQHHSVMNTHRESLLIRAQIENSIRKDYRQADEYFSKVIPMVSDQYISRRLEIFRQFLVNRINWTNSKPMPKETTIALIQEAVDTCLPIVEQYPFCDNKLALNLVQIANQMPVRVELDDIRTTFGQCEKFVPYF